jgi:hypothetical protein
MALLPLLFVFALVLPSQSKEASVKGLQAKVEALEQENAALKEQIRDFGEVPYFSTQVIVDSLGSVTGLAMNKGSFDNVDLTPVYSATSATKEALSKASEQATAAASSSLAKATEALKVAAERAQDLHGKHASQHTEQYYKTAVETYTEHLEPHVATARKAYYDSVHPHVGAVPGKIYDGVGAAVEGGKKLPPILADFMNTARTSVSEASKGPLGTQLGFLVKPQAFTVMGRTFRFNHGFLDVALAAVQGLIAAYLAFKILGQLLLRTIVWRIGVQLLGKKVCLGLTSTLIKVSYKGTKIVLSLLFSLVLTVFALSLSFLFLFICGAVGIAILHAIETSFTVGLTHRMRLLVGASVGSLFFLICRIKCCRRKKVEKKPEKATNGKNGKENKAPDAKKQAAAKSDAKQATKPTKKK